MWAIGLPLEMGEPRGCAGLYILCKYNKIIHFERSPPDGDCYSRAIEVVGQKGVPVVRELRGGETEGSSRRL